MFVSSGRLFVSTSAHYGGRLIQSDRLLNPFFLLSELIIRGKGMNIFQIGKCVERNGVWGGFGGCGMWLGWFCCYPSFIVRL